MTSLTANQKFALCIVFLLVLAVALQQRGQAQSPVQVGVSSPLPVYVTNTPALPEGFAAGSKWRFTTWTRPSVMTWIATVNKTSGAWAHLTVRGDDGSSSSSWYYVPAMEGSWEQQ